jgi:hypothetical protein
MLIKPIKNMKKVIYALILPLVVVSGLVFANREISGAAKIKDHISASAFGVMVRVNGYDYILSFGRENSNEFQQLHSLKVNDKIFISSHSVISVSYTPNYSYPIISGDYVERDGKIIYKRAPRSGGC